jgi:hypothetical protein
MSLAPERDDGELRRLLQPLERPGQPLAPLRGRVARHAGIGDPRPDALAPQIGFELRHEALRRGRP